MLLKTSVKVLPSFTLKGTVKYLSAADASERERVLHDFKYPEVGGPNDYYGWSMDAIHAFHRSGNDVTILRDSILKMEQKMKGRTPQAVSKLENNLRVVESYQAHFIRRELVPMEPISAFADCEGVYLNMRPDLIAREKGKILIVQFLLSDRPVTDGQVRVQEKQIHYTKQMLLFFAGQAGLEVKASDCQVFVVSTGEVVRATGPAKNFEAKLKSAMREARRTWGEI